MTQGVRALSSGEPPREPLAKMAPRLEAGEMQLPLVSRAFDGLRLRRRDPAGVKEQHHGEWNRREQSGGDDCGSEVSKAHVPGETARNEPGLGAVRGFARQYKRYKRKPQNEAGQSF